MQNRNSDTDVHMPVGYQNICNLILTMDNRAYIRVI
jgi:hypothetical protein